MSEVHSVNERVIELETVCSEIPKFKNEIKILKSQLQRQENSAVSCDLRINGIPFKSNEDLTKLFNDICKALNIPTPACKSIFRLQKKSNIGKESQDAVIIVKLCSPYDKNFILKSMASFRKNCKSQLCLHHIGFQTESNYDNKIYINENLTPNNFKILQAAINLRKKNRISSAFTLRGIVYIKVLATDVPKRLDEVGDLNKLFLPNDGVQINPNEHFS